MRKRPNRKPVEINISEISFMGMGAIHPDHQVLKMHHAYWQRNFVPESLHLPDLQR